MTAGRTKCVTSRAQAALLAQRTGLFDERSQPGAGR